MCPNTVDDTLVSQLLGVNEGAHKVVRREPETFVYQLLVVGFHPCTRVLTVCKTSVVLDMMDSRVPCSAKLDSVGYMTTAFH